MPGGMEASVLRIAKALAEPGHSRVIVYTRRQAIEDGVLVDLMQPETVRLVREGFQVPACYDSGRVRRDGCRNRPTVAGRPGYPRKALGCALDADLRHEDRRQHQPRKVPRQCVEWQAAG